MLPNLPNAVQGNAGELAGVVGDEHQVAGERLAGDKGVQRPNRATRAPKLCSDLTGAAGIAIGE